QSRHPVRERRRLREEPLLARLGVPVRGLDGVELDERRAHVVRELSLRALRRAGEHGVLDRHRELTGHAVEERRERRGLLDVDQALAQRAPRRGERAREEPPLTDELLRGPGGPAEPHRKLGAGHALGSEVERERVGGACLHRRAVRELRGGPAREVLRPGRDAFARRDELDKVEVRELLEARDIELLEPACKTRAGCGAVPPEEAVAEHLLLGLQGVDEGHARTLVRTTDKPDATALTWSYAL